MATRESLKRRAAKMRQQGSSFRVIGETLGVSQSTIHRWIKPQSYEAYRSYNRIWRKTPRGIIGRALHMSRKNAEKYGHVPCTASIDDLLNTITDVCQMCNQKSSKSLHLDHDHDSGDFRGWLCYKCNWGLGVYEQVQQLASDYLRRRV